MVIIDKRSARGGSKTAASDDIYGILIAYVNDVVYVTVNMITNCFRIQFADNLSTH